MVALLSECLYNVNILKTLSHRRPAGPNVWEDRHQSTGRPCCRGVDPSATWKRRKTDEEEALKLGANGVNNDHGVKVQFSAGKSPAAETHSVLASWLTGEHLYLQQAELDSLAPQQKQPSSPGFSKIRPIIHLISSWDG